MAPYLSQSFPGRNSNSQTHAHQQILAPGRAHRAHSMLVYRHIWLGEVGMGMGSGIGLGIEAGRLERDWNGPAQSWDCED